MAQRVKLERQGQQGGKGKRTGKLNQEGAYGAARGENQGVSRGGSRGDNRTRPPASAKVHSRYSDPCVPNVPSPNRYRLKNLVGYVDHDISKWKGPAYTMAAKNKIPPQPKLPGPKYNVGDLTRHGPKTNIAHTMGRRIVGNVRGDVPGPSSYSPEKHQNPRFRRAPSATIKSRMVQDPSTKVPSPADYKVPGGIGKTHPSQTSTPAAVITGRSSDKKPFIGPGPNRYGNPNMDVIRKAAPMATLGARTYGGGWAQPSPGPGAYNPKFSNVKRSPSFSFGIRHSDCLGQFKTEVSDYSIC